MCPSQLSCAFGTDHMTSVRAPSDRQLKALNPTVANITYDIADLYAYLDQVADISMLIYSDQTRGYMPHNKEWVKRNLFSHLKGQAHQ